MREINTTVIGRDEQLKQILYALIINEHVLLMGEPGMAKSLLAREVLSNFDNVFDLDLTKQTLEEHIFGPLDFKELENGRFINRIEEGGLNAEYWFLDEFFDASDALLRSILGVLNERTWNKGHQKVNAKLKTAILTSNYQRLNEMTEAVIDRILFKSILTPISSRDDRMNILKGYLERTECKTEGLQEKIVEMSRKAKTLEIPDDVLSLYLDVVDEYSKEMQKGIRTDIGEKVFRLSQRTVNKALRVIQASAVLNNRKVTIQDIRETKYALCTLNKPIGEISEQELFSAVCDKILETNSREKVLLEELEGLEFVTKEEYDSMGPTQIAETLRDFRIKRDRVIELSKHSNRIVARKATGLLLTVNSLNEDYGKLNIKKYNGV